MQATVALLRAFRQPLAIEQIALPTLAPGQALVRVEAAGVCGSDVHMWQGRDPRTPLPMILGHEGVGRIEELAGPHTDIHGQPVRVGQRILWERGVTCGRCHACAILHEPALCAQRWVYGIHRSSAEPPHLNGCYATHIVLDAATHLIPLDEASDPAMWVAASCSGATAAHGFDLTPVQVGQTVVILGPGPLGAFSILLARAAGAEQIVLIGGTGARLEICRALGATHVLSRHTTDDAERRATVLELTHGRGADVVIEAAGSLSATREALALVRPGGSVSLVGFGTPMGELPLWPFEDLVRRNVRLQGVWVSNVRHTLRAISLVRQYPDALRALVTHRYPLTQATHALEQVEQRETMKAVLLP